MKELEVYLVDPGNNDLGDALGVSHDRAIELQHIFENAVSRQKGNITDGLMAVSKVVTNANELAYISYSAGWNLRNEELEQENEVNTLTQLLKEHLGGDVDVRVHKLKKGEEPPEELE